jgi:uncharacterized protein YbjT (DUF2867 family)
MASSFVVVCGATGNQGGAVVDALLRRGRFKVRAHWSADPRKAAALADRGVELATGDLVDTDSLVRAFSGAAGIFGVTQPWSSDYRKADVETELAQGRSLVEASSSTQINLVLSTVFLADHKSTGIPHVDSKIEIEKAARKLGKRLIILGPGSFFDNIGQPWHPVRRGRVRGFVGRITVAFRKAGGSRNRIPPACGGSAAAGSGRVQAKDHHPARPRRR